MATTYKKPILVVDDDENILRTFERFLSDEGYQVIAETNPQKALEIAKNKGVEVVVSDINMPEMDGIDLLRRLLEIDRHMLVIMVTAVGSEKIAVEAMKAGAYHYLPKPVNFDEFNLLIERAIDRLSLLRENEVLKTEKTQYTSLEKMVGASNSLERVRQLVRRVSASPVTVLVTGESGTGKELVAQSLHKLSNRANRPFVKINCAAIPETLLESELFGHERGAFTGAVARRIGKFELAHQGTIFLDEIGDMTPATQTKLLRVLQEQELERIGGKDVIKIDVRVIAATNRNLATEIAEGRFREDLFYRINVIEIHLPPLRERPADIPLLIEHYIGHFTNQYGKEREHLSRHLMEKLRTYHWPGNIRELKNCIERAVILGLTDEANFEFHEPRPLVEKKQTTGFAGEDDIPSLEYVQCEHIKKVLDFTGGNKTRAARILKIDPKTLRSKLKALEKDD